MGGRAHPEEYGPLTALDDDEFEGDDESAEALEAATTNSGGNADNHPAALGKDEKKETEGKEKVEKDAGKKGILSRV